MRIFSIPNQYHCIMPNTVIILSGVDATSAVKALNDLLTAPKTLLLILGTDAAAQKAQAFANGIVTDPDYVSVQFIFAPNRAFIVAFLKSICVDLSESTHALNWADYAQYTVFALSPTDKCIADVVPSTEINTTPGSISTAILAAWAIG